MLTFTYLRKKLTKTYRDLLSWLYAPSWVDLFMECFKEPHRYSPELTEGNNEKSKSRMPGCCCQDGEFLTPTPSVMPAENWNRISDDRFFFNTPRTVSMRWICSRQRNTAFYFFFFSWVYGNLPCFRYDRLIYFPGSFGATCNSVDYCHILKMEAELSTEIFLSLYQS
jgi:hypothetical protein